MNRNVLSIPLMVFLCGVTAFGQMQLSSAYSRSVKTGQTLPTSIDSLMIDMKVNNGLAVSRYTMVLTPGAIGGTVRDTLAVSPDSIEITMGFQLPSDFLADSMWLWINGEPVAAEIQDRALASAQYQKIVGVRKDPAILETSGRGSYNLRIFPAASLQSRKITVEFRHTFDDDSISGGTQLATACIPVFFDSSRVYYYASGSTAGRNIGVVTASFDAGGTGEYAVDLPGVGSGTFSSSKSLMISARNVARLQPGSVATSDVSGSAEYLWTGRDSKVEGLIAGVSANLSDANMTFEPEPDVRIIAIDMRNTVWDWNDYYNTRMKSYNTMYTPYTGYEKYNVWERAQKYAVLALQQYCAPGQKFNVLINGKTVQPVFSAPVEVTTENLTTALTAILTATASADASTEAIVKAAIAQAPEGIVLLVSDLVQPPDYTVYNKNVYTVTPTGIAYDTAMAHIRSAVRGSAATFFTIDDNYQVQQIAFQSGGYRLSGILNRYNVAYHYQIVNGKRVTIPELPRLFGSTNTSGLRNLSVTSDALTDVAYTLDGYYSDYYYYGPSIMVDDMMIERAAMAKMVLPYNSPSPLIRIAGKLPIAKSGSPVTVTVRGKTGGLWFTCPVNAVGGYPSTSSSVLPMADPQWAYRLSEQLGTDDYIANAGAIKTIGKTYHIVTRQTSLLALEPGMKLWEDTAWQQQTTTDKVSSEATSADASYRSTTTNGGAPTTAIGNGVSFDGISLADIVAGKGIAAVIGQPAEKRAVVVTAAGAVIRIGFNGTKWTGAVTMRLFDLKGRMVAQRIEKVTEGAQIAWNVNGRAQRLTAGMYMVSIASGSFAEKFRITLAGN